MNKKRSPKEFIDQALFKRKEEHRFRELHALVPIPGTSRVKKGGKEYVNFCSNDYLGLATHPKVIKRSQEFAQKYGAGSGASRLVSGTFDIHTALEEKLKDVFDAEAVLLFNSGFQANTTILSSLAGKDSLIIADKKCHNSLIQGAMLSRASFKRFKHNDYSHLEKLLAESESKKYDRIWIVSETVFSMDGDRADVDLISKLSEYYGALFYSDDAHALGVLGEKGLGLNYGRQNIELSLGAFGKAFGAFGAFASCSLAMKEYLVNFCPGFIYTTALPPGVIGAIDAALDLVLTMDAQRQLLIENVNYLKEQLSQLRFDTGASDSQIIPIIVGAEQDALKLSGLLESSGLLASAIRPPTVESGASRIRITLTVNHTRAEIDQLLEVFALWKSR